jgi:hypothetical protein
LRKDAKKGVSLIASKLENFLKTGYRKHTDWDIWCRWAWGYKCFRYGESKIIDVASKGYSINGKIF